MPYKPLYKEENQGTGNSRCKISKEVMVSLNNTHLLNYYWDSFLNYVIWHYDYEGPFVEEFNSEIKVVLSKRKTVRQWGKTQFLGAKITINRQSVWVFLHELAHMITYDAGLKKTTVYKPHGKVFGEKLTEITQM